MDNRSRPIRRTLAVLLALLVMVTYYTQTKNDALTVGYTDYPEVFSYSSTTGSTC